VALLPAARPEALAAEREKCPADAVIWKNDLRPSVLEEVWNRFREPPVATTPYPRHPLRMMRARRWGRKLPTVVESVPAAAHEHHRFAWRTWVPWALVVLATVIGLVA